jgi:hypothetical protein
MVIEIEKLEKERDVAETKLALAEANAEQALFHVTAELRGVRMNEHKALVERERLANLLLESDLERGRLADRVRILERAESDPGPLTEAEARVWAAIALRPGGIRVLDVGTAILAASRGEIPPEVRQNPPEIAFAAAGLAPNASAVSQSGLIMDSQEVKS